MGNRKKTAESGKRRRTLSSVNPLPNNHKLLETLLAACQRELDSINSMWRRVELQFADVERTLHDPNATVVKQGSQTVSDQASQDLIAASRQSAGILRPYVSQRVMAEIYKVNREGVRLLRQAIQKAPSNSADEIRSGYRAILRAFRVHFLVVEQLRNGIFLALDEATRDTMSDAGRKKRLYVPKNPYVTQLYALLELRDKDEQRQIDVAKEFAEKVGKNPMSLLRGVQRLRKARGD
jgi:hypothetical protein